MDDNKNNQFNQDNQFDALDLRLKAYFKEKEKKILLDDVGSALILKTKLRLRQKAEARDSLMVCLIQIGFWLMAAALGILAFITIGVNTVVVISIIGYITGISLIGLIGVFLVLFSSVHEIQIEI
jgi:hypothetical protein